MPEQETDSPPCPALRVIQDNQFRLPQAQQPCIPGRRSERPHSLNCARQDRRRQADPKCLLRHRETERYGPTSDQKRATSEVFQLQRKRPLKVAPLRVSSHSFGPRQCAKTLATSHDL